MRVEDALESDESDYGEVNKHEAVQEAVQDNEDETGNEEGDRVMQCDGTYVTDEELI